jgi:predicted ATP-grasp superfamily ATP-dependent carboligase
MGQFRIPAIVFGGGINGLGIARNLAKEGIEVQCVVEGIDTLVFSKFCRKHFIIPNFRERKDLTKRFFQGFSKENTTRAVVFATDDISTLLLSGLQHEIKDDYYFVVPRLTVAEKLVNKGKFYESLIENKVAHPRVIIPSCIDDVKRESNGLQYPIYIRPSISPDFDKAFRKKGFIANSATELVKYYNLASKHNVDVIFQEIIPGSDKRIYCIAGFFNRESMPLALFAYHRLRGWPNMFGNGSLIESVAISKHPFLKETVIRYLSAILYSGLMDAEFKLDARDGKFKLLEINTRSWWQNSFPTKCGLNIILRAYLDAIGEKAEYSENYATGIRWINLRDDIRSSTLSRAMIRKGWIGSFKRVRDWAFFDIHDPIPCAANFLLEAKRLFI